MDTRAIKKLVQKISQPLAVVLVAFFLIAPIASAIVNYPASASLGTGSVRGSHILDGTLTNADVSASAAITSGKITVGGTTGTVMLTDGTNLATTTSLKFATSTKDLYVLTGRVHASSTNFGGRNLTWPTDAGSSGYSLQTNGSGTLSWANAAPTSVVANLTTSEILATGDIVGVGDGSQIVGDWRATRFPTAGITAVGRVAAQTRLAINATTTSAVTVNGIIINLAKTGAPSDNLVITIEGDSGYLPDGSPLATVTIPNANLTTSETSYHLYFSPVSMSANTAYWLVVKRSGAVDFSNYPMVGYKSLSGAGEGVQAQYDGTSWGVVDGTVYPHTWDLGAGSGTLFRVSALNASSSNAYVGFSSGAYATSTTAVVAVQGTVTGLTGLTSGKQYYLGNATSSLSTTVGATTRKACLAVSTTSCLITNIW